MRLSHVNRHTATVPLVALSFLGLNVLFVRPSGIEAAGSILAGQVRGQSNEQINGIDHVVERYVGRPDGRSVSYQLTQLGVRSDPEDRIEAFPDPSLGIGSAIRITRATEVSVIDSRHLTTYRTWVTTVEALLKERQIEMGRDDTLDVDIISPLEDKMTLTVTRVELTELTETEPIAFKKTSADDSSLEKGQIKLIQAGHNGVRTKRFRVRRENGTQVEKTLIDSVVTEEPVTEQTIRGTKVIVYGTGQATWYALKSGFGAAHNSLPKGTKVHVVNSSNGKSVDVVINDHGIQGSAIIDLTKEAFERLAPLGAGRIQVRIEKDYD
jgi:hypothetical protein